MTTMMEVQETNNSLEEINSVIVKLTKDIEYLKDKVYQLETEKLTQVFNMSPEEVQNDFMVDPPTTMGMAKGRRPLLEAEILEAQKHSDCAAGCARYLHVSYKTYKKWATRYGIFKTGDASSKGAKKKEYDVNKLRYPLDKILEGETFHPNPWRFKMMLFKAGKKSKVCERCGWKEKRDDGVPPLVINFKDGNPENQILDNVEILCYNCTYVLRGYIRRGGVVSDLGQNNNNVGF